MTADYFITPVRAVFQAAYGQGIGTLFMIAAPCALVALVAVLFIREVPLRTTIELADEPARSGDAEPARPVREKQLVG